MEDFDGKPKQKPADLLIKNLPQWAKKSWHSVLYGNPKPAYTGVPSEALRYIRVMEVLV